MIRLALERDAQQCSPVFPVKIAAGSTTSTLLLVPAGGLAMMAFVICVRPSIAFFSGVRQYRCMTNTTKKMLVAAAARLLDEGGLAAMTLRAVASEVGVSHNAPYRHFPGREALLAGVAESDFYFLAESFNRQQAADGNPRIALLNAAQVLIDYARQHQARYQLLFRERILPPDGNLKTAAMASFEAFSRLVQRAQNEHVLPPADTTAMTGVIYATLHGAIELELSGRSNSSKGLASVEGTINFLFELIGGHAGTNGHQSRHSAIHRSHARSTTA